MKTAWIGLAAVSFVVGCGGAATPPVVLRPEAAVVKVSKEKPQNCAEVGELTARGQARDPEAASLNAKNEIRNKAAALSGNQVTLEDNKDSMVSGGFHIEYVTVMSGHAYKCP
jgi:hypothetical protein